jgi:hypothetical protein
MMSVLPQPAAAQPRGSALNWETREGFSPSIQTKSAAQEEAFAPQRQSIKTVPASSFPSIGLFSFLIERVISPQRH